MRAVQHITDSSVSADSTKREPETATVHCRYQPGQCCEGVAYIHTAHAHSPQFLWPLPVWEFSGFCAWPGTWREGRREGGKEGGREGGREEGREGRREASTKPTCACTIHSLTGWPIR